MIYRHKPTTVEATQWFKNGDHPLNDVYRSYPDGRNPSEPREGLVVRYFRHPEVSGKHACSDCGIQMHKHGWIDSVKTLNPSGCTVCPGDFVITEPTDPSKYYPCKPGTFRATYEPA